MTVTADLADPAFHAYLLLRNAFTITLILVGADKLLNARVDGHQYLAPAVPRALGVAPEVFLWGVGNVEIAAGSGSRSSRAARLTGSPGGWA